MSYLIADQLTAFESIPTVSEDDLFSIGLYEPHVDDESRFRDENLPDCENDSDSDSDSSTEEENWLDAISSLDVDADSVFPPVRKVSFGDKPQRYLRTRTPEMVERMGYIHRGLDADDERPTIGEVLFHSASKWVDKEDGSGGKLRTTILVERKLDLDKVIIEKRIRAVEVINPLVLQHEWIEAEGRADYKRKVEAERLANEKETVAKNENEHISIKPTTTIIGRFAHLLTTKLSTISTHDPAPSTPVPSPSSDSDSPVLSGTSSPPASSAPAAASTGSIPSSPRRALAFNVEVKVRKYLKEGLVSDNWAVANDELKTWDGERVVNVEDANAEDDEDQEEDEDVVEEEEEEGEGEGEEAEAEEDEVVSQSPVVPNSLDYLMEQAPEWKPVKYDARPLDESLPCWDARKVPEPFVPTTKAPRAKTVVGGFFRRSARA